MIVYTLLSLFHLTTYYPHNSNNHPDVLDLAIIKTNQIDCQIKNFFADLPSDHSPITLKLNLHSSHISPPKSTFFTNRKLFEDITLPDLILPTFQNVKHRFLNILSYRIHLFNHQKMQHRLQPFYVVSRSSGKHQTRTGLETPP